MNRSHINTCRFTWFTSTWKLCPQELSSLLYSISKNPTYPACAPSSRSYFLLLSLCTQLQSYNIGCAHNCKPYYFEHTTAKRLLTQNTTKDYSQKDLFLLQCLMLYSVPVGHTAYTKPWLGTITMVNFRRGSSNSVIYALQFSGWSSRPLTL